MIVSRVSALALAAVLGLSVAAQAQTPPPPPPGGMAAHHSGQDGMKEQMAMHQAARLRALHEALNVRPDQEAAFQAFAAAVRPGHPDGMADGHGPGGEWKDRAQGEPMAAGLATPERLDRMLKRFDERTGRIHEALARHAEAVKTFYAVLTPEQRHTFDALPALIGHPGGGMGHGPMGGMRPGGMHPGGMHPGGMGPGGMGMTHPDAPE